MGYRPRVVVQFHDYVQLPYVDKVEKVIQDQRLAPWKEFSKRFPGVTFRRVFTSISPEKIRGLIKRATEIDPEYKPENFFAYFLMDSPPGVEPEVLAKALREWPIVKKAYYDPPGDDPVVDIAGDSWFASQGHLKPAEEGIDAEFAWESFGGDGEGMSFIDMEQGWTLEHEDLAAHGANLLHGTNAPSSQMHGTAVLGVVCALDNDRGCLGVCPNLDSVNVVSYEGSSRPEAIIAAIAALSFGDVLLLESHVSISGWNLLPIEVLDLDFKAIRLATALGIVVVEAGGNGANDLDSYQDEDDNQLLNRSYRDSGAIMVGAASPTLPHTPLPDTNFGTCIDCFAWGEGVTTCRSFMGATTGYRSDFGGTSSAAAIVAGAALAVQGIVNNAIPGRFSPKQLRAILRDPAINTHSADPGDLIGVMPNLKAIIEDVLNVVPDVYIRDYVGDEGDPHTNFISASPDIILLPTAVADPQAAFGEGSGTENNNSLGHEAEAGQDNFIYVRVRNRGGSPATNVVATVFSSPAGTLITPEVWKLVGTVTIPNVPEGDILTVSDPITWKVADIPDVGHYCFVGLVGTERDPDPERARFEDWDNFQRFIRENNNVTWRNFNVVDNDPATSTGPAGFVTLSFIAPGAPDKGRKMRLEIGAQLPRGSRVFLEGPRHFMDRIKAPFARVENGEEIRIPCNPHARQSFEEMVFPAKSRTKLSLLVQIPEAARGNPYEVYARQVHEGQEVGRVTWRLVPSKFFRERKELAGKKL